MPFKSFGCLRHYFLLRTDLCVCLCVCRLAAMKRELKVKELALLDAARMRFLKHQQNQRKMELNRLDDEIQRKVPFFLFVFNFCLICDILLFLQYKPYDACVCVCVRFIQMAMREQETTVAVQDIEVRQMELDAQRRLFEQVSPCYRQRSDDK